MWRSRSADTKGRRISGDTSPLFCLVCNSMYRNAAADSSLGTYFSSSEYASEVKGVTGLSRDFMQLITISIAGRLGMLELPLDVSNNGGF